MKLKMLLGFAAASAMMAGCQNDSEPAPAVEIEPENPVEVKAISLSARDKEVLGISNAFAWQVFSAMLDGAPCENALFSPVSLNINLSMLANGASGTTLDQMLEAMGHGDLTLDDLNSLNQKLADAICNLDAKVRMSLCNSMWHSEAIRVNQRYASTIAEWYGAEVAQAASSEIPAMVNSWCAEKTHGLIKSIYDDEAASMDMSLANALYFKAPWHELDKFLPEFTTAGEFTTEAGVVVEAEYMNTEEIMSYCETDVLQSVKRTFGDGQYAMTFVLPKEDATMAECLQQMAQAEMRYEGWEVELSLPKFDIESKASLRTAVQAAGITEIFSLGADFTPMSPDNFYVSDLKQGMHFKIDEEGAEGAAVTVTNACTSDLVENHAVFKADRPFLFMVADRQTNSLIFLGKVANI